MLAVEPKPVQSDGGTGSLPLKACARFCSSSKSMSIAYRSDRKTGCREVRTYSEKYAPPPLARKPGHTRRPPGNGWEYHKGPSRILTFRHRAPSGPVHGKHSRT